MLNSLQIETSIKIEKKTLTLSTLASRRGWRRRKSGLRRRWRRGPGWSAWRRTRTTWHRRLMVDIDLLDKINRTKVAAGPWSGWPLDKLQTPVRWIAGIISSSLSSSASSSLSSSASYCHHCHQHHHLCHHQHPTETISLIGLPLARLPRIAKTTTPAKTEVRELQRPTMKASLWKTLRGILKIWSVRVLAYSLQYINSLFELCFF